MSFPEYKEIPTNVLIDGFCGQNSVCAYHTNLFINHFVDKNKPIGVVDTLEVQTALHALMYGRHPQARENTFIQEFTSYLRRVFFANSPFDGKHSTIAPFVTPANTLQFKDGDTYAVTAGGRVYTFRLGGIDAPESFLSEKLTKLVDYIYLYWIERLGFRGDEALTKGMIRNRIRYTGYLAGLVVKGLDEYLESKGEVFYTVPSFDRTDKRPELVNTLVLADDYKRLIGVLRVGNPTNKQPLLAEFIEDVLPMIMATKGMELYEYYRHGKRPEGYPSWLPRQALLDAEVRTLIKMGDVKTASELPKEGNLEEVVALTEEGRQLLFSLSKATEYKEVYDAISPDTLPNPKVMFSKGRCKELAKRWRQFSRENPSHANDIQAMLVFLGLAWAYPKYANQETPTLLALEKVAMGKSAGSAGGQETNGLWGRDIIFGYGQPNPNYSPLYRAYEYELSRGRELVPEDACDVLKRKGGDTYNHCP
jgi:hypothetical protein